MPLATKARPIWEDRFARPSADVLLAEIPKPTLGLVSTLRDGFLAHEGMAEELAWQGIPWRWAFAFSLGGRVVAYIVPNPLRPVACIPVPAGVLTASASKKLSKPARDVIRFAPSIGGVQWPQWDITSKALTDELATLVRIVLEAPVPV